MNLSIHPKRLWVDFNEVYEDDFVWTSLRNSTLTEAPEPGEWVYLVDDDGEACMGLVSRVDGPIVHCKIDWSTWTGIVFSTVVPFRVQAVATATPRAQSDTDADEQRFTPIAL